MPQRLRILTILVPVAFFIGVGLVSGYVYHGSWPSGSIVMHLQLGSSSGRLMDGSSSWGQVAESALAEWNTYIQRVEFRVVRDSTQPIQSGDRVNSVFWSSTVFGRDFGDSSGWALWWFERGELVETDVIFNTKYAWNSYRGPLQGSSTGGTLFDLRRIALHEFGHGLGLGHSPSGLDVMYWKSAMKELSDRDRSTLLRLYGCKAKR